MTTNQAFENLISGRAWYSSLDIVGSTARSYAKRFRDGNLPIEKIEEILALAGYRVKQEKLWEKE